LLVCSETIRPLTLVRCYPIGVIIMKDGGKLDEKIIAVPFTDPMYNTYTDISELPCHVYEMMVHFFSVYKNLENGKGVEVEGVYGPERAREIINECIDHYIESFCR
ncbi:MAG: inorganic diphosphatase, partial [Firmicutes bacterium]|nr:inorganic diphosphatase [Bacillota bacterium]